jgi:hypothetical protein
MGRRIQPNGGFGCVELSKVRNLETVATQIVLNGFHGHPTPDHNINAWWMRRDVGPSTEFTVPVP